MKRCLTIAAGLMMLMGCSTPPENARVASERTTPETATATSAVAPLAPAPITTEPAAVTPPPSSSLRDVFPHVRVDVSAGIVEFDASVPIDAHDERTPLVYLEVVACPPDTKEHESLLVTSARGRDIHAALLMIGLQGGAPARWDWTGPSLVAHPPSGDAVEIIAAWGEGASARQDRITTWIISKRDQTTLDADGGRFVFAGSRMVSRGGVERYEAEGAGTLIGLTTFGSEMIAWSNLYHHDSSIADPQWIANAATMPPRGTRVVVRIRRAAP